MFKYNIMLTSILCTFLSAGLVNCRAEGVGTAVPDIPQVVPEQAWLHDPFTPSTLMYERARMQGGKMRGAYGFIPSPENTSIPRITLRGLLNKSAGEFIALLEVQGMGTFMVREGDEFNINPSQPENAIRISKITRLSVTVEAGHLGSIRVLR